MAAAIISALAAIIASAGAIILTKAKERDAIWRAKKLTYYEEFFGAASGIVGAATPLDAKVRFANAVNNLHLIASQDVISSLHRFTDEISEGNAAAFTQKRHDQLWSELVWEIRFDLGDAPGPREDFRAKLWASGVGANVAELV
ncbi:hypothetical protein [Sphingomonas sanguinis]|uniref:hypothetical protein n=1 Tax=Sphingomonas sanguinis TaxID=33051 RepID=UPI0012E72AED|nr:hypothetical protein [Sphingomonas sanguinis]